MPQVLISDKVAQQAIDLLNAVDGFAVVAPGKMNREAVMAAIPSADALIIRSGTQADAELLAAATQLKAIARAGVGVDNVDLTAASERGIVVMNTPGGNTISTAEHTFGLMLALARHIPQSYGTMREGGWDRSKFSGVELRGKTLGIVGFGRIGRAIATRALAFEMTVIAYDPYIAADTVREAGAEPVDLDTLFARADFITLHTALSDETRGMINAASLAKMKAGVRIVNAARGGLIVDEDLAEAIQSGQVAGAALDVYAEEPPAPGHPLVGLDGVIHTPHLAASTSDAQIQVGIDAAQQIIAALTKGEYVNVVNPDVLKQ